MLSLADQNRWRDVYRQQRPDWRPATEVYANLVRAHLTPTTHLLDLGCGRGGLVEQLVAGDGNQYSVSSKQYSVDSERWVGIDPDMASLQQHRLPDLPRVAALSDALPLRSASFDLVFCSWLLEHLARPYHTFAEIGRLLRPDGVFIFITPNARHPLALLNAALGRVAQVQSWLVSGLYGRAAEDAFPTTYRANTAEQIRRLAQPHGLHLAELHAIPDPSYLAFHPLLFRLMVQVEERLPARRKLHLVGLLRKDMKDDYG
jgi:SAM-dependent methyltransferase